MNYLTSFSTESGLLFQLGSESKAIIDREDDGSINLLVNGQLITIFISNGYLGENDLGNLKSVYIEQNNIGD